MIESTAAAVGEVADDAGVRGPQRHRRLPLELVGERSTWVNVTAPRRNSLSCKPRRRRRRVAGVPPRRTRPPRSVMNPTAASSFGVDLNSALHFVSV